jgi:hypothetical protein
MLTMFRLMMKKKFRKMLLQSLENLAVLAKEVRLPVEAVN